MMTDKLVKKGQLITHDQAKPCKEQITQPCTDCPWARTALPGWLGALTADEWLREAHGEARIDCHTLKGPQCAGAAIYRANMLKLPRDRNTLRLPKDKTKVFATPTEFKNHHEK
jgi:hypothetical protein